MAKKIDGGLFGRDYEEVEKWDGSKEIREVGFFGFSGDKVADVRENIFGGHSVTDSNGNSTYASSSEVNSASYYDGVASGSLAPSSSRSSSSSAASSSSSDSYESSGSYSDGGSYNYGYSPSRNTYSPQNESSFQTASIEGSSGAKIFFGVIGLAVAAAIHPGVLIAILLVYGGVKFLRWMSAGDTTTRNTDAIANLSLRSTSRPAPRVAEVKEIPKPIMIVSERVVAKGKGERGKKENHKNTAMKLLGPSVLIPLVALAICIVASTQIHEHLGGWIRTFQAILTTVIGIHLVVSFIGQDKGARVAEIFLVVMMCIMPLIYYVNGNHTLWLNYLTFLVISWVIARRAARWLVSM